MPDPPPSRIFLICCGLPYPTQRHPAPSKDDPLICLGYDTLDWAAHPPGHCVHPVCFTLDPCTHCFYPSCAPIPYTMLPLCVDALLTLLRLWAAFLKPKNFLMTLLKIQITSSCSQRFWCNPLKWGRNLHPLQQAPQFPTIKSGSSIKSVFPALPDGEHHLELLINIQMWHQTLQGKKEMESVCLIEPASLE